MAINRFYIPRASFAELLSAFAAQRKAKNEAESGLQAQADAQQNEAIAGAATNVGMGVMGGLTARALGPTPETYGAGGMGPPAPGQPGLSRLDQFALASSFVPSMRGVSATAMGISDRQADRQMHNDRIQGYRDLENLRSQNDVYQAGVKAYAEQYGELPAMAKVQEMGSQFAPGAIQPDAGFDTPGFSDPNGIPMGIGDDSGSGVGMPLPSINPMATQAYRKAEQTVQAIDTMRSRPMSAGERQDFEAQVGPVYQQAQQVLRKSQPPPPPSNFAEWKAAVGGVESPYGLIYQDQKGTHVAQRSRDGELFTSPFQWDQLPADQAAVARDGYLRRRIPDYDKKLAEGWSYVVQNNGDIDSTAPKKDTDSDDGFDEKLWTQAVQNSKNNDPDSENYGQTDLSKVGSTYLELQAQKNKVVAQSKPTPPMTDTTYRKGIEGMLNFMPYELLEMDQFQSLLNSGVAIYGTDDSKWPDDVLENLEKLRARVREAEAGVP